MSEQQPTPSNPVERARKYIESGFRPIPVEFKGKRPLDEAWPSLSISVADLEKRFGGAPRNIGIVLGQLPLGLVDVDLDHPDTLRFAEIFLPSTKMIFGRASNLRSHWIYQAPDAGGRKIFKDPEEGMICEVRGRGHHTVFPGSVHESDELIDFDEDGTPSAALWQQLVGAARNIAIAVKVRKEWKKGIRHHLTLALAGTLAKAHWRQTEVRRLIRAIATDAEDEELSDRLQSVSSTFTLHGQGKAVSGFAALEALLGRSTAETIFTWCNADLSDPVGAASEIGKSLSYSAVESDVAAATTFSNKWKGKIVYCDEIDAWFEKHGQVHEPASPVRMQGLAMEFAKDIAKDTALDRRDRKALQSRGRIDNVVTLSRSQLRVKLAELDADTNLVGCKDGGIIDLDRRVLVEAGSAIVTKKLGTEFDPGAKCPVWANFLARIFERDFSLIQFAQRAIGYSLTGRVDEQCLLLLVGKGANGKSTVMGTLQDLFGDYAGTVPMQTLMVSRSGNEATNDLAMLPGKRFVAASEGEHDQKLAEAKIKLMTGGDRIMSRKLYQNLFEYQPQFKLWLMTNNLPKITGTDEAIWRRIYVIPFPVTIPVEERDPKLRDRLRAELPGILNWALDGLSAWQAGGLKPPDRVRNATSEYRLASDTVAQFIEACCIREPQATTLVAALYTRYVQWCDQSGVEAIKKETFGKTLGQKGLEKIKQRPGSGWRGLALIPEEGGAGPLMDALDGAGTQ